MTLAPFALSIITFIVSFVRIKFTKSFIKALLDAATRPKNAIYTDTETPGFVVRVRAQGVPVFGFRWKSAGQLRFAYFGSIEEIGVEEARNVARDLRLKHRLGHEVRPDRKRVKMEALAARHIKEHAIPNMKPVSVKDARYLWEKRILPEWKDRAVDSITKADVITLRAKLSGESKVRANHVLALLSRAFTLAEDWGYRPEHSNPCLRVERHRIAGREKILSEAELSRFQRAMVQLEHEAPPFAALFSLLLMTGARLREIMHAKLSWVDFDRCLLLLPDSKTGRGDIQLSEVALQIIKSIKRPAGSDWLIDKGDGTPIMNPYKRWRALLKSAGVQEMRPHDLRHCFGSYSHRAGASQKTVAKLLRHSALSTTERYITGFDSDRKDAADFTSNAIAGFMGRSATPSGEISD